MENEGVSPTGVIEDLANQVRRLSVDCAVLRTAIKELQVQNAGLQDLLAGINPSPPDVQTVFGDSQLAHDDGDET